MAEAMIHEKLLRHRLYGGGVELCGLSAATPRRPKVERLYLGIKHSKSSWASFFVYRVYEAVVVERVEAVEISLAL